MRKHIREGEVFPRGYGFAWQDWYTNRAVCYPIPLNVLFRGARNVMLWLRHPNVWMRYEDYVYAAYETGFRHGNLYGAENEARRNAIVRRVLNERAS